MIATRILETLLTVSPSQNFVTFDTLSAAVTSVIGSLPSRQSVSLPLASGPSPTLHLSIPTDGTPNVQYQRLMELAKALQGMPLSVRPSVIPAAPEVPLQPTPVHHAFPSALPPGPSPQLLIAPTMGAWFPPPTSAQHYAQHAPPSPGGQSFGLVGA